MITAEQDRLIRADVAERLRRAEIFTAADIANSLGDKDDTTFREIEQWLTGNIPIMAKMYTSSLVHIEYGVRTARVYHPRVGESAMGIAATSEGMLPQLPAAQNVPGYSTCCGSIKTVEPEEEADENVIPASDKIRIVIENVETLIVTPDKLDFQTSAEE